MAAGKNPGGHWPFLDQHVHFFCTLQAAIGFLPSCNMLSHSRAGRASFSDSDRVAPARNCRRLREARV